MMALRPVEENQYESEYKDGLRSRESPGQEEGSATEPKEPVTAPHIGHRKFTMDLS